MCFCLLNLLGVTGVFRLFKQNEFRDLQYVQIPTIFWILYVSSLIKYVPFEMEGIVNSKSWTGIGSELEKML